MMFKKICSLVLASAVAMPFGGAFAKSADARTSRSGNMYYIRGRLDADEFNFGDRLTVLMKDGGSIKYINETGINADGSYSLVFECDDAANSVSVKAGCADVSDSVCYAGTFDDMVDTSIVKTADGKNVKIFAEVKNAYLTQQDYTVIAAAYGSDGMLKNIETKRRSLDGTADANKELFTFERENASRVSLMIFENLDSVTPLCKSFSADDLNALPTETDVFYNRYEVEDCEHSKGFTEEMMKGGRALTKVNKSGYFVLKNVDMTGVKTGIINAGTTAGDRTLEVRLDSADGKKIGEVTLSTTETQFTLKTTEFKLNEAGGQKHNVYFVDNSKNDGYTVDFVILSNEVPSSESGAGAPTYVNSDSKDIVYTGDWQTESGKGDFYRGGDAAVLTGKGGIKYEFYGTGIDLICDVTESDCNIDIYIDGIKEKTQNLKNLLNEGQSAPARTVFTKTGLKRWKHAVEITAQNGKVAFDAFKIYTRPIRVVCVGDSITDGGHKGEYNRNIGTADREYSWPHEMNKILGDGYLVFNCGQKATTTKTYKGGDVYVFKTAKSEDADIVINTLGYNDYGTTDFNTSDFKDRFVSIMDEIQQRCTTSPRLYVGLTPFGAQKTASDQKRIDGTEALRELSAEKNWPIVDFCSYMLPYRDNKKYFPDGTHPYSYEATNMMAAVAAGQLPCAELTDAEALTQKVEELSVQSGN